MAINLRFVSSSNVSFNLYDFDSAKLEKANFHKVSWQPEVTERQFGVKVNRFTKEPLEFDCTFKFKGDAAKRKQQIDDFIFQTEKDVADLTPGRIWWNNQYIEVYFASHDTHPVDSGMNWTEIVGRFYAPYPFWIEEQTLIVRPSEASQSGLPEDVKGYPEDRDFVYGYEYSYPYAKNAVAFTADSALPSDFKAVVYGPIATGVNFSIAGHVYKVNYPLKLGQVMIIDTRDYIPLDKKCYVITANGTEINVFDYREPTSLLFVKIPSGQAVLNYARSYGIDLTIFQERSAPI